MPERRRIAATTAIGERQPAPRLLPHRARLRRRQRHDVLQQRAARRPRRHRRLRRARRLRRRAPVLPHRRARDDGRRLDRAAGRAAVRDRCRLSGQAARHQQRGPAPARVRGRATSSPSGARTRRSIARSCALDEARALIGAEAAGLPVLAPSGRVPGDARPRHHPLNPCRCQMRQGGRRASRSASSPAKRPATRSARQLIARGARAAARRRVSSASAARGWRRRAARPGIRWTRWRCAATSR